MVREKQSRSLQHATLVALNVKFQELAGRFAGLRRPRIQGRHRHPYPSGCPDSSSGVPELRLTERVPATRRAGNFITVQIELSLSVGQANLISVDLRLPEVVKGYIDAQI